MSNREASYYIEQIDAYLDGKLDRIDRNLFENAINENPSLKVKLESHITSRSLIRKEGEQELKSKFLAALNKEETTTKKPKSALKKILVLLAILLAVIISYFIFPFYFDNTSTTSAPLALSAVEDPSYSLLRSNTDTTTVTTWREAIQTFVNKDYSSTLMLLDSLEADSMFISHHIGKYTLMKGVSYLKSMNYESAENTLSQVSVENPYYDQVEWYLALTSFYDNEQELAKNRLNIIVQQSTHYKKDEARKYLKSLE